MIYSEMKHSSFSLLTNLYQFDYSVKLSLTLCPSIESDLRKINQRIC